MNDDDGDEADRRLKPNDESHPTLASSPRRRRGARVPDRRSKRSSVDRIRDREILPRSACAELLRHQTAKQTLVGRWAVPSNECMVVTPGNGLDVIQIQLDFGTYLLLDLDQVGYGYPFTFDQIGLDSTG